MHTIHLRTNEFEALVKWATLVWIRHELMGARSPWERFGRDLTQDEMNKKLHAAHLLREERRNLVVMLTGGLPPKPDFRKLAAIENKLERVRAAILIADESYALALKAHPDK